LAFHEGAKAVGKFSGSIGTTVPDEVGGVAAPLRLAIEGGIGFHVMTDVGDVHADADVATVERFDREGVSKSLASSGSIVKVGISR